MQMSARNQLKGKVINLKKGPVSTDVVAIIKASNVMIGK